MTRYSLPGRTVVITGAAGGIGSACARALHVRGANVVLTGRDEESLRALARSLGRDRVLALRVDVMDRPALEEAFTRVVDRFGRLDVVFANAGTSPKPLATIATIDPEEFERVVQVNLFGVWRTVRAALPHIIAARGHVLVTASVYAFGNGALNGPYAASKAAVEQFVRALRVELALHHATAGVLYPGWVRTAMTHDAFGGDEGLTWMREAIPLGLGRAVSPQSVARRVLTGIENRSPRIVVPRRWQPLATLRGIADPFIDHCLARHEGLQALLRQRETAGLASNADRSSPQVWAGPSGDDGQA